MNRYNAENCQQLQKWMRKQRPRKFGRTAVSDTDWTAARGHTRQDALRILSAVGLDGLGSPACSAWTPETNPHGISPGAKAGIIRVNSMAPCRLSHFHFHDCSTDDFRDLRNDRVAKRSQTVHPSGNPKLLMNSSLNDFLQRHAAVAGMQVADVAADSKARRSDA